MKEGRRRNRRRLKIISALSVSLLIAAETPAMAYITESGIQETESYEEVNPAPIMGESRITPDVIPLITPEAIEALSSGIAAPRYTITLTATQYAGVSTDAEGRKYYEITSVPSSGTIALSASAQISSAWAENSSKTFIFVCKRNGVQVGITTAVRTFSNSGAASIDMNARAGDTICVYLTDSLTNDPGVNPRLYMEFTDAAGDRSPDLSSVRAGEEFYLAIKAKNLTASNLTASQLKINLAYTTQQIELTDICALTPAKDIQTSGLISGTNITVNQSNSAGLKFTRAFTLPSGYSFSGVVNVVKMKAKVNNPSVTCVIEGA